MTTQAAHIAPGYAMTRAFEAGWLAAAVLVPAAIMHEDFMLGFIQMPKVFALRTTALYLVAMFAIEWAVGREQPTHDGLPLPARVWAVVQRHPAKLVIIGAVAVLSATLASVAFAPVKSVAIWGIDPGWDTYALVNLACYLVLFTAVATHLRTGPQLRRLVWALTAVSMVISLLSIGQHFGIDPFRSNPAPAERVRSTFGNPIFAGSYLLMTVPLTIALFTAYRHRFAPLVHVGLGAGLVTFQFAAVLFSFARGPWVGFVGMAVALVVLLAWTFGSRVMLRAAASTAVALMVAVVVSTIPVPGVAARETAAGPVIERIESVIPDITDGLNNRSIIWRTAVDVFIGVPWVDTEAYPEIPGLGFRPLRRVVGFGPDHFGYAYPMAGESTYTFELASHGHSFFIHTMIELGFLGLASYFFIFGALVMGLLRIVRAARNGAYPEWFALLAVGLSSALVGRVIEQIPGKAQISDLALSWMLAAIVVAMSTMRFDEPDEAPTRPLRRARSSRRTSSSTPLPRVRVAGAAVVVIAVIAVWFVSVVPYVVSARLGAQAEEAARRGDGQRSMDLHARARDVAPDLAVNRLRLGGALFSASRVSAQIPRDERADIIQRAYDEVRAVLDRNPLDHRAWSRAGEYLLELAVVTGDASPEEAVRDAKILTQLLPGFWQSHAGLASAYVRVGAYEQGLRVSDVSLQLSETTAVWADVHRVFYLNAVASDGLGRTDDAIEWAKRSINRRPNTAAQELLDRLTPTPTSASSS